MTPATSQAFFVDRDSDWMKLTAGDIPDVKDNVQDVYPLTPLQEGLLFHHLLGDKKDSYVLSTLLEVTTREQLNDLIQAIQATIDRYDALRVSFHWDNLPAPLQVVRRRAPLQVQEFPLTTDLASPGGLRRYLDSSHHYWDLQQAPLVRLYVFSNHNSPLYALLQLHHIVCDFGTLRAITSELVAQLTDRHSMLSAPTSFRDHIANVLASSHAEESEEFFREKLHSVSEPTLPFDIAQPTGGIECFNEASQILPAVLSQRLRLQARRLQISAARLFHAAWALVIAHTSGRDDVVFGTVILAEWQRDIHKPRILGLSINTLPLRLRLRGVTAIELVERTQQELKELLYHDQTPLVLAQRCSGVTASTPLFGSIFNYRHVKPQRDWDWSGVPGIRLLERAEAWTNYPITMLVDDSCDEFSLLAQTDSRISATRVVGYLATAIHSLVEALEHAPSVPALQLSVVPDEEHQQILRHFNATERNFPHETLIHELFETQVQRTPDKVAVTCKDTALTYSELDARANQLARYLIETGIGPDKLVGVFLERGLEMVLGLLGILKSGGAYVSLDPNYPADRLKYILQDSSPRAVLTQDRLRTRLPNAAGEIIALDSDWSFIGQRSRLGLSTDLVNLRSGNLAYLIYTSGSTGRPKGVAIEHKNTVNLIRWAHDTFDWGTLTRTLHSTSLNFDLSVYECFVPLSAGGTIRVVENALELLQESAIVDLINTVPSAISAVLDANRVPEETRTINLAGEALKKELVERIFTLRHVDQVCNLYGPSETTTYSTWISMAREEGFLDSIGKPIANTQVYILDTDWRPVPLGVVGEIYVGGTGVARGYLKRPELTAERFIADPFGTDPLRRMYKTGDLGRWRPDGVLEYLGCNDHQVKIRGFRIELGEIESRLARHQKIKEAAVIARENPAGDRRLIAYVVYRNADEGKTVSDIGSLRSHLSAVLPDYMVPSTFVTLEQLPMTPNGKLNRQALPPPDSTAFSLRSYEPPQGEIEGILSGIWKDLLGTERVGRDDNFFELGGNSLLIVQMLERLRRVGLLTEVRLVFEAPRLAELANKISRRSSDQFEAPPNLIPPNCDRVTPEMLSLASLDDLQIERIANIVPGGHRNIQDIYPLTPLQDGILFHHLLNEGREDVYVMPTLLSVTSRQRVQDLISGLQHIVNRHDALRTVIVWSQLPQPLQVVTRRCDLPVEEVALDGMVSINEQLASWTDPRNQHLDLQKAPLLRVRVASDPHSSKFYALLQIHHIICDNTALDTILCELVSFLEAPATELPAPVPYRHHAASVLARTATAEAASLFESKLRDVNETTAPFGLLDIHGDAGRIDSAKRYLPSEFSQRIRGVARKVGVSPATLFHCAWALVVALTSNRDDVTFGTVLLGRTRAAAEARRSVGLYINTLPLRVQLAHLSTLELLYKTQRELVDLLSHEHTSLPFAQGLSGLAPSIPLFTSIFNYRHRDVALEGKFSDSLGIQLLETRAWTNYPMLISIDDLGDGFIVTADVDQTVKAGRITEYLYNSLESVLYGLDNFPHAPALSLNVLPEAELRVVLSIFNDTTVPHYQNTLIHRLFEEQARRTPNVTAVLYDGIPVTYMELERKVDALAALLRSYGVRPDNVVGLCIGRTIDLIVAILATLKAGGAYLPLDQSYPVDRLNAMLEDAKPTLIIADRGVPQALHFDSVEIMRIDDTNRSPKNLGGSNGEFEVTPDNLLYVIYTSGSTGRPKGIAMSHGAMGNLLQWHRDKFGEGCGKRVLQYAAMSFDVAFQEIFSTLCTGATLVLIDDQTRRDAHALLKFLQANSIERLFIPPVMLQSLAEISGGFTPIALRDIITAGEQLKVSEEIAAFCDRGAEIRLHNHYGPTETHVVTELTLNAGEKPWPKLPTIGLPISNTEIYLLNRDRKPVPLGVSGEIYIGGYNVARGYLNRPEFTAERFISNPFNSDDGIRLYKTGDLGRWRDDGTLEYLGRNDDQVKIRGFRVELGEIEVLLAKHPAISQAIVVTREVARGDQRLVAYLTGQDGAVPTADDLRAYLSATLPSHMIPSAFVSLQEFPLTPSGKINRRLLPSPGLDDYAVNRYEAPQDRIEEAIAAIWQRLLLVDRVGRNDNFFELGGHSLIATRVVSHLRETLQVELAVATIFTSPTVSALAEHVVRQNQHAEDQESGRDHSHVQDLRKQIEAFDDHEVARRIAELEGLLGSSATTGV